VVSSLPFPHPPDLLILCGFDVNVMPFVRVEDWGAEGWPGMGNGWLVIIVRRLLNMKGKQRGKGGDGLM
jgi:hypothetical protein